MRRARENTESIDVWITKYALTSGIEKARAEVKTDFPDMATVIRKSGWCDYFHKNDWHRTEEAAFARAEQMRQRKIVSLRRSLKRFEEMSFALQESET